MFSNSKIGQVAAAILFLIPAVSAAAQVVAPPSANEIARLKQFLDKKGGYKDQLGGYYDPQAGTYSDSKGGVVDNWRGYTYADGSYKSANGDYWDAPKNLVSLASGDSFKPDGMVGREVIETLRKNVEDTGGYDKNYIFESMIARIAKDHPQKPQQ